MTRVQQTTQFMKCLYSRFREDDVPALGAQLTYYLILAVFPFLIFMVSILGLVQLSGDSLINELIRILPTETGETLSSILTEVVNSSSRTLLSFGMIATIWSASNGLNAIMKGLNKAYDRQENRPFWKVRGISIAATLVLAVVILFSMLMVIFGKIIGDYLFQWTGYSSSFEWIWSIVKYVIPFAAMLSMFTLLYWVAPNEKLRIRAVIPGALFATLGWIVISLAFQFYINNFGNYSKTYGSLGGIIVLLIWLYMSSNIIILGGEINATLASARSEKPRDSSIRHSFRLSSSNNFHIKANN